MSSALVNLAVKQRDACALMLDSWNEFLETLNPTETKTKTVPEETFFAIAYDIQTTEKLGMFEVADRQKNDVERFALAFSILKANENSISNRYHGPGYVYAYWLFSDRIYRQILKK